MIITREGTNSAHELPELAYMAPMHARTDSMGPAVPHPIKDNGASFQGFPPSKISVVSKAQTLQSV